jgi:hypothetical protein
MSINYPTNSELEAGYAQQEAEMRARRERPIPPEPRDQDEHAPPPSVADRVFCPVCGLRFDHPQRPIALMSRGRHLKAEHPDTVEAG